jgi:uncharacterized protein HemY
VSEQTIASHVDLVGEAHGLRGAIRAAADAGDVAEVTRLVARIRELEDELFAREITDVRHTRAQRGRGGGYNPSLERVEALLSERLARLGVPVHQRPWQG